MDKTKDIARQLQIENQTLQKVLLDYESKKLKFEQELSNTQLDSHAIEEFHEIEESFRAMRDALELPLSSTPEEITSAILALIE